jgi:hypothetical protein
MIKKKAHDTFRALPSVCLKAIAIVTVSINFPLPRFAQVSALKLVAAIQSS